MIDINIASLSKANKLAKTILDILSADKIIELAKANIIPYYKLINPKTKEEEFLFHSPEIRKFISYSMVVRVESSKKAADAFLKQFVPTTPKKLPKELQSIGLNTYNDVNDPVFNLISGVYFLYKDDELVYIGKSVNFEERIKNHMSSKDFNKSYVIPMQKHLLLNFERIMIQHFNPRLNGTHAYGIGVDIYNSSIAVKDSEDQILNPK